MGWSSNNSIWWGDPWIKNLIWYLVISAALFTLFRNELVWLRNIWILNRSDNKKKSRKFLNHVCVTWICSVFSFIFREVDQQSAGAYLVEYFGFLCLYFQVWNRSLDYCLAQNWRRKSHNPLKVSWYRFNLQEVLILSFIFTFAVSLSI